MGMVSTMLRNLEHCMDTVTSVMFFLKLRVIQREGCDQASVRAKVKLSALCH